MYRPTRGLLVPFNNRRTRKHNVWSCRLKGFAQHKELHIFLSTCPLLQCSVCEQGTRCKILYTAVKPTSLDQPRVTCCSKDVRYKDEAQKLRNSAGFCSETQQVTAHLEKSMWNFCCSSVVPKLLLKALYLLFGQYRHKIIYYITNS